MSRMKIGKDAIICRAAQMANESGEQSISLKLLAQDLGIQPPSLYYYFKSLDDLKRELMLYGWRQMEEQLLRSMIGVSGYDAIRAVSYAFYRFAVDNPGVFNVMLWYNQYEDKETSENTSELFATLHRIMDSLNISEESRRHLIRTVRGFLQGFILLVNHKAFGDSPSIEDSFEFSLNVLIEGMKSLEGK